MRKMNDKLEPFDYTPPAIEETAPVMPTLEQRLEAVEGALLEQLLRGLENV